MRVLVGILLVVLSSAVLPASPAAQGPVVVRSLVGRTGRVVADTMGNPYEIPAAAGRAFSALAAVYDQLKVPPVVRDSALLELGSLDFDRRGDLAGVRMSAYLNCGSGPAGDYADFNRVTLTIISFLTPSGTASVTLRTVFYGYATTENARGYSECYSNGEFEKRLYKLLLKKLTG